MMSLLMDVAMKTGKSVDEIVRALCASDRRYNQLESTLLAIGGERMVWLPEPHLDHLLSRGKAFSEPVVFAKSRRPSECHRTSVRMYLAEPGVYQIATGYALSDDGLWRQHSWLWKPSSGKLYEPTPIKRDRYYGFLLTDEEAARFAQIV